MVSTLFCNVHVWSLRRLLCGPADQHLGINIYHDKTSSGSVHNDVYKECKRQWVEDRGINWSPPNKRPEKLRDNLHDLEEILDGYQMAALRWKTSRTFQMLLSNAALVTIQIGFHFADIEKLTVDKSLAGKISEHIYDAVVDEMYMVLSFMEKSKLVHVQYGKRFPNEKKDSDKLSAMEPKLNLVDIPGPAGRKLKRKLAANYQGDLICAWWPTSSEEAWPWSPLTTEQDRSNLILLQVSSTRLDVVYYLQTDSNPLDVSFSHKNGYRINTLEQSQSTNGKYTVDTCSYEYIRGKLQKTSVVSIPSKAPVVAHGRNHSEDKLLLGCEDGTLILFDEHRRLTQMTTALLSPVAIVWHPSDTVIAICSAKGDIQIFDMALATIALQLSSDTVTSSNCMRLGQYFQNPLKIDRVSWTHDVGFAAPLDTLGCYEDLLLFCERGPMIALRFQMGVVSQGRLGAVELISDYVRHEQELEAVNFLNSMNWNTNAKACFACLTIVLDYMFKLPFNLDREGCIEDALGSFYAPSRPLSESVIVQFRDSVSRLARRFFHHLLRHKRFEKAFLLAVDIGAKDLFMDIHYVASDIGNDPLAEAARNKAMQLHQQELAADEVPANEDYGGDAHYDDDSEYDEYGDNYGDDYHHRADERRQEYEPSNRQLPDSTPLEPMRTRKHAMMNPAHMKDTPVNRSGAAEHRSEMNAALPPLPHQDAAIDDARSEGSQGSPGSRRGAPKKNVEFVHFGLV